MLIITIIIIITITIISIIIMIKFTPTSNHSSTSQNNTSETIPNYQPTNQSTTPLPPLPHPTRRLSDHKQKLKSLHGRQIRFDLPGNARKGSDFFKEALLPLLDAYGMVVVGGFYRQFVPESDNVYIQVLYATLNRTFWQKK